MRPFDESGAFRPFTSTHGLRRLALRGAGVTIFSQSLGFVIQMIATVILARLLTPADFGLLAMVTTFSLLLMNCGLNGFTETVLNRQEIDHALVSNLFWVNLGLGILLTIGFAVAGSLMVWFYGEPQVQIVTGPIALSILFTSLSVMHLALLKRAMWFSMISAIEIIARIVSVTVSILLALDGWSYWALVAGFVSLPLTICVGSWFACRWVPRLPVRADGTGSAVRFAVHTYGRFAANYLTRNLDNLLIGWRFGALSLGFYKKAYDLFVLPASQISSPLTVVAVSALSRLAADRDQYKRHLLRALTTLAFVGMALAAILTLVGADLIFLLLGPGWEESGRIFRFFGPGIGMMLLNGTHGWIHLSIGRADRWLRWGVFEISVTTLLFLLGLPWGGVGIAVAWTVSFWLLTIPSLWYAGRPIQFGVAPAIGAIWKYVLASAAAGMLVALITQRVPFWDLLPGALAAISRIGITSLLFLTL